MNKRFWLFTASILVITLVLCVGCSKDSSTPLSPSSKIEPQVGTISGVIKDMWTSAPINGAVISLAYNGSVSTVTSNAAGAFSFSNVPVENIDDNNKPYVARQQYTLSISLVDHNKSQSDSTKRYRNYYYDSVTVSYSSVKNDTTGIYGLVGTTVVNIAQLNSTINGTVVDQNMQPVANALVYLYDESITPGVIIGQTTSAADGTYSFKQVDNGITINITALTTDGKFRGSLSSFYALSSNRTTYNLNPFVTTEALIVKTPNNVAPFVYQITPSNNADVATNTAIVYSFTAPIKQTPYTRTDLGLGYGTMLDDIVFSYNGLKKSEGTIAFSAVWNSTYTVLTITPISLIGSAKYSINVATVLGKLTDNSNVTVTNNATLTGDFETLSFTTTGNSAVPAAPVLTRRVIPGVFSPLDYTGGTVGLEWAAVSGARSYNIYRSKNGGTYELYRANVYNIQDTVSTGSLVYPNNAVNPMSAVNAKFKITAVSNDLAEGPASNEILVNDQVAPKISSAVSTLATDKMINIYFSEPLIQSSAELTANYQLVDTATITPPVVFTITQASYLGSTASGYRVILNVNASSAVLPAHIFGTVSRNVTDLNGNAVDTTAGANRHTF